MKTTSDRRFGADGERLEPSASTVPGPRGRALSDLLGEVGGDLA